MAVYVDSMKEWPEELRRRSGSAFVASVKAWCHMWADSEEELHRMAEAIGLKRSWYQGDHYDLTESRRRAALRAGAKEADHEDMKRWVEKRQAARFWAESGRTRA